MSCRAAEFLKFSMDRKFGFESFAGGCPGGSLTGVLGSQNPSSPSIVIGFSTDPTSFQGKRKSSLCHISRFRNLGVVLSHMLRHFLHHLHGSKWVLSDGNLRHMMFVEISSHHLHHVLSLDCDVHSC